MDRPVFPDDLTASTPEELAGFAESLRAFYADHRGQESIDVSELRWASEQDTLLKAETSRRQAISDELAAMDATFSDTGNGGDGGDGGDGGSGEDGGSDGEGGKGGDGDDGEGSKAVKPDEAVTASGVRISLREVAVPKSARPENHPTAPVGPTPLALVASAGQRDMDIGSPITDWDQVASVFDNAYRARRGGMSGGNQPDTYVASLRADFGTSLVSAGDSYANTQIMREARDVQLALAAQGQRTEKFVVDAGNGRKVERSVLVADGGICGPADPLRTIRTINSVARPVADAGVNVGSSRGNVVFVRAPSLADVTTAVDVTTSATDEAGSYTKSCFTVVCPPEIACQVQGISACMTVGQFQLFSNPEWVRANVEVITALWARVAERELLDDLVAASIPVGANQYQIYGSFREYVRGLNNALASYRSAPRLGDATVEWLVPFWMYHQMRTDVAGADFDLEKAREVDAYFSSYFTNLGVRIRPYLDSATAGAGAGGGVPATLDQVFPVEAAGGLNNYPTRADTYLFAEGVVGHLMAPSLDFGFTTGAEIVDGTLVRTNDVRMFAESFERFCWLGGAPIWRLVFDTCPTGLRAPLAEETGPDCALIS